MSTHKMTRNPCFRHLAAAQLDEQLARRVGIRHARTVDIAQIAKIAGFD